MDELWAALDGAVRPLLLQICAPLDQLVETLGVGAVDPTVRLFGGFCTRSLGLF